MIEDDKAKESYLEARGWVRIQRRIPYAEHWMLAWQAADQVSLLLGSGSLPLDAAVVRQLKQDALGMSFFLQSLDDSRPGTRLLIGGDMLLVLFAALKEFCKDKEAMVDAARKLGEVMRDLEDNPEAKVFGETITRAYEMGKRKISKGQAN